MTHAGHDLPSGIWRGHFEQFGNHYPQHVQLEFADGMVRGNGVDDIGTFTIEGEYRSDLGSVRVGWIKTYDGAHSVLYLATLANRKLTGQWKLQGATGGFTLDAPGTHTTSNS